MPDRVCRIDALRTERQEEVLAGDQARLFQHRLDDLSRRPRIGRGFEHHQLPGPQGRLDGLCCRHHEGQVRVIGFRQRGGDTDHDHVGLAQSIEVERRLERSVPHELRESLGCHVRDMGTTGIQPIDDFRLHIEPERREPRLRKSDREGKPHVSKSDDAHDGVVGLDAGQQVGVCSHIRVALWSDL